MNSKNLQPLLAYPCIVTRRRTIFRLPQKDVEMTIPSPLTNALIASADGTRSFEELISRLQTYGDRPSIKAFLEDLCREEVLIDGRNLTPLIWQYIQNPSPWHHSHTDAEIEAMVRDQRLQSPSDRSSKISNYNIRVSAQNLRTGSVRSFGDKPISVNSIIKILNAAYGVVNSKIELKEGSVFRRSVPSAGALYPINLHLVLLKSCKDLPRGGYRILLQRPDLISFQKIEMDLDLIPSCFVDRTMTQTAAGFICISGELSRSPAKYGNRGLMYTVLEAGHVAQAALHEAQKLYVATCEIGGFYEERLQKLLKSKKVLMPLTTIFFGSNQPAEILPQKRESVTVNLPYCVVAQKTAGDYKLPFTMVFAEVVEPTSSWWACGRSRSPAIAKTKALAEALEWSACGRVPQQELVFESFASLRETALDPRVMSPYLPGQLREGTGLKSFRAREKYEWKKVTDLGSGNEKLVLADFIYFPYVPRNNRRYAYASSSGCAAHVDPERAINSALLELAEREAFLVMWLNRYRPPVVRKRTLPEAYQKRIAALEASGFVVSVVDATLDLTPVPVVTLHHPDLSFFTCSAASALRAEEALDKALMEAEASAYCRLRDGRAEHQLHPAQVKFPEDHALLYESAQHIRRALFLQGDMKKQKDFRIMSQRMRRTESILRLMHAQGLTPYALPLESSKKGLEGGPVHVVRAIVPGMIPMIFGNDTIPLGLPRVRDLARRIYGVHRKPSLLVRFPHPFN